MNNFEYFNPTRLVFGKGEENRIGELLLQKINPGEKVLLVYGGSSAKKSGLIDPSGRFLGKSRLGGRGFRRSQTESDTGTCS